ncbi:hypothetical protein PAUR_a3072 [Pseudoalteromonas aurantia 208]|uniref:Glycosyl transferase family 1 domain-containing protein n=1 Tax=Pseudoalteromonas aurantia 208 TaxID=1314867 RepID=A0ABR9EER2_9GAMM|nr:hypothetical protein [Pseudoalteromonas aurantia 208]
MIGVLSDLDLDERIAEIHVWTYRELAEMLPKYSWLTIHLPEELERGIFTQVLWQRRSLPKALNKNNVDILLSTDAGTVCRFYPSVVMSRDMLSFEDGEMGRYFPSKSWLRLLLLKYMQVWSLKSAQGTIFLTQYAENVISNFTGKLTKQAVIPHGISEIFRKAPTKDINIENPRFIYVSNADKYKHQWHVVEAFFKFRALSGKNATLTLVGANSGPCAQQVNEAIQKFDDGSSSVTVCDFLPHNEIPLLLHEHDIFIFASSCENMPNTLIEAMSAGLPVICSDRGPMPEVLTENGVYFDPEVPSSIVDAMLGICSSVNFAIEKATVSYNEAAKFSWNRCSKETFTYMLLVLEKLKQ